MMRRKTVLDMAFHHFSLGRRVQFLSSSSFVCTEKSSCLRSQSSDFKQHSIRWRKNIRVFAFHQHICHIGRAKEVESAAHCVCYTMKGMNCLIRSSETEWNCLYVKIAQSSFDARLLPISTLRVFLSPLLSLSCMHIIRLTVIHSILHFCFFSLLAVPRLAKRSPSHHISLYKWQMVSDRFA